MNKMIQAKMGRFFSRAVVTKQQEGNQATSTVLWQQSHGGGGLQAKAEVAGRSGRWE